MKFPKLTIKRNETHYGYDIMLNDYHVPCCQKVEFLSEAGSAPICKLTIFVDEVDIDAEVMTEIEAVAVLKMLKNKSLGV